MPKSTIPLCACESSQIAAHGYDPATQTLALQFKRFKDGTPHPTVYHYANVTPGMYAEFQAAESKERFFGSRIKNNTKDFPFTKMVPDEDEQTAA